LAVSLSAEPLRPGELPAALARLIGQHPSAIRSICFSEESHEPGALGHLEIETKHGFVTLIDHRTGETYAAPPAPPAVRIQDRQQRDLTDELPGAFAERPRFSKVEAMAEGGVLRGWRFELDTGAAFTLTLDERLPIVAAML
jgi:hypothetical protein